MIWYCGTARIRLTECRFGASFDHGADDLEH